VSAARAAPAAAAAGGAGRSARVVATGRPARVRRLRAFAAATLAWAASLAALDVPFLAGRVVDTAQVIDAEGEARIDAKLAAFEREQAVQVAVLTVPSLEGEVLEDYSQKVVATWKLGREEQDDGVLLLVVPGDRQMRIEVGYGVEGKLTDLQSREILDNVLRPHFQRGELGPGIEAGVDSILGALRGEEGAIPEPPSATSPAGQVVGGLVSLFVLGIFGFGALMTPGCQGWFLYAFLTPFIFGFTSAFTSPVVAMAVTGGWLVLFPLLKLLFGKAAANRPRGAGGWTIGPGGWGGSGGGWSSGGGGWSSGGGGFSGGGGSFGGGGASGRW
jgi:uncharacterized protein